MLNFVRHSRTLWQNLHNFVYNSFYSTSHLSSLSLFAEQNGNVKQPSVWSCWPKQVIMLHSKDYMVAHRTLVHGPMLRPRPLLARDRQQHHHPQPICTIAKRPLQHYKNHYHIVCIRVFRPWARWAVCLVQVRPHFHICLRRVRCLR